MNWAVAFARRPEFALGDTPAETKHIFRNRLKNAHKKVEQKLPAPAASLLCYRLIVSWCPLLQEITKVIFDGKVQRPRSSSSKMSLPTNTLESVKCISFCRRMCISSSQPTPFGQKYGKK
jgi:hypothetical protein